MVDNLTEAEKLAQYARIAQEIKRRDEAAVYEGSLIDFVDYAWEIVEPAKTFVRGWAVEAVCEHLEAVTNGEIIRLLMNVPPGFTKSLITDVFWPAWEWGPRNLPHMRYVCASYASHLTVRDNMRFRSVVTNHRYTKYWGHRFAISGEQATKIKLANDHTGWKFATSVGGVTGGERGDRFIIDDANNPQDTESQQIRTTTNHWFLEVVPDRLNSITESAIIAIQQRLHEDDVSGTALTHDLGYVHLMIPMEYDPARHCVTVIGWQDPRGCDAEGVMLPDHEREKHELELAWPERFPPNAVETLKQKGPYAWSGQYQQSPEPRGGGIFKRDWWRPWNPEPNTEGKQFYPKCSLVIASLDTAYTQKEENDPSALTIWGVFHDKEGFPRTILLDAWRKRLELHGPSIPKRPGETDYSYQLRSQEHWGLVEWVAHSCKRYKVDRLLIESKAAGISAAQEIRRLYGSAAWGVQLIDPKGDKVARAYAVQHLFSEGIVYAPQLHGDWTDKSRIVIDEAASFPKAAHDDLVDTLTQALKFMRDNNILQRKEEVTVEREEELKYQRPLQPLYNV